MKTWKALVVITAVSTSCLTSTRALRAAEHGDKAHREAWAAVKQVVADIEGLNPGQKHAFHIHQFGDCTSSDGMSAGGHYNPEGHQHGLPEKEMRHAGDLGNLTADNDGKAHYEITVSNISVAGMKNPIIGRGVIVHAKVDDGSQPVGNAGGRIACGVIGVANPGGEKK